MLRALSTLAVIAAASATVLHPQDGGLELLVLHNNDMHARFEQTSRLSGICKTADRDAGKCYGGFARVAHVVKQARKESQAGTGPPVLYLNAGDTYTGTAWFSIFKWEIAAEFINALKPDAVSLGNHEFDNGIDGLTPFIDHINTSVVAANLNLTKVPELANDHNLHKSVVFNISGVMVGIIGYLTPDTAFLATKNNVQYVDEVVAIRKEVAALKSQGVKILIALGHSGWATDQRIAKEVDGIDLVIGGHTNTFLWNGTIPDVEEKQGPYPTMVKQASGKLVPAVQAYAYTKYLGKLHLVFDKQGELVSYDGSPILLDNSVPQDPEVVKLIDQYRSEVSRISEEVIGTTSVLLDGITCRLHECNLGNFIADATVYYYAINYNGTRWTDAPIAVIQGGGVRTSIDVANRPGNITRGDLMAVMPFGSNIVGVTMNGDTFLEFLEHSVADYNPNSPTGQFLQFSGVRVTYDLAQPVGHRVKSVVARCWDCYVPQYYTIDSWRSYKVLMSSFMAEGGDGYSMLVNLPHDIQEWRDIDAVTDYVARRSPVYPEVADRITLLNENQLVIPEEPVEPEEEIPEEELVDGGGNSATVASPSCVAIMSTVLALAVLRGVLNPNIAKS